MKRSTLLFLPFLAFAGSFAAPAARGDDGSSTAPQAPSAAISAAAPGGSATHPFTPGTVGFTLRYKSEVSHFKYSPIFLLPRDQISLRVEESPDQRLFTVAIDGGTLQFQGLNTWQWSAPDSSGFYSGQILCLDRPDTMHLQIFVMTPRRAMVNESLEGYQIGHYPAVALRDLDVYRPPEGFIRVTTENQHTRLTPHFTLQQFLCKQAGTFPKFVVLQERLLYKLEHLLQKVNEKGYACQTFAVMSGYRTPAYNRRIGNRKYSQHCYGGAADIYIDADLDQVMDDLNRDGRRDYADAGALLQVVEWVSRAEWFAPYIGGLARYRANRRHGPFVHVDVRGFSASWGD